MASKKYLIIAFAVSAGVAFGVFSFAPVSKTLYIKNSASYLVSADNKIGDLSNTIIPPVNVPENLTENFAAALAQELISQNLNPTTNASGQPALAAPNVKAMAEEFITNGLTQANENILNIKQPNLKISRDNSKAAIENYLSETRAIINNNLSAQSGSASGGKTGASLYSILDEINKNNGAGLEKLLPIISAHEAAANQLEEKPVPSDLKDLMTEEIKLLRITANILRALTNIQNDPLGTIAAAKQFESILQNWQELQKKSDLFIQKINRT